MAKVNVSGIRTRTVTTVITDLLNECEVDITKEEVMRVTGCASTIDGDPKGWYDYIEEALRDGAKFKISTKQEKEVTDILEGDDSLIDEIESHNVLEVVECIDVDWSDSYYGYAEVEKSLTEKQELEIIHVDIDTLL